MLVSALAYIKICHTCTLLFNATENVQFRVDSMRTIWRHQVRVFPVAATHLWNSLSSHITAVLSLSIFCCRLKSHLFSLSYPAFWLFSHLYSAV